jgi:hypothetical protein
MGHHALLYPQHEHYPVQFPADLPQHTTSPSLIDGFIPPHLRDEILSRPHTPAATPIGQTPKKPKKTMLTLDELRAVLPDELAESVDDCEMDGCGTDVFGIPMCLPVPNRNKIIPYVNKALKQINNGIS